MTWRDATPSLDFMYLQFCNAMGRSAVQALGRVKGQAEAVDVWPVQYVLSNLRKVDSRHCSYKDLKMSDFRNRERRSRSIYCHTAVLLLLQQLHAAEPATTTPSVVAH